MENNFQNMAIQDRNFNFYANTSVKFSHNKFTFILI